MGEREREKGWWGRGKVIRKPSIRLIKLRGRKRKESARSSPCRFFQKLPRRRFTQHCPDTCRSPSGCRRDKVNVTGKPELKRREREREREENVTQGKAEKELPISSNTNCKESR